MNTATKRGVLAAAGTVSLVAGLVSAKAAPAAPSSARSSAAGVGGSASTKATTGSAPAASASASASPVAPTVPPSRGGGSGTFTGDPVDVGYGTVQVQIVMTGGKITDVKPLTLPSDRSRSRAISNYAAPVLRGETLKAQDANIDGVSGATYTSEGYAQSLQSAIDRARA